MFAVDEIRLLSGKPFDIGVGIKLYQPMISEIAEFGESEYMSLVSALTSEPFDMPYYLDQMGIDFEKIKPFELFCILTQGIPQQTSKLLLGELDLSSFKMADQNGELILVNDKGVIINSHTRERSSTEESKLLCTTYALLA